MSIVRLFVCAENIKCHEKESTCRFICRYVFSCAPYFLCFPTIYDFWLRREASKNIPMISTNHFQKHFWDSGLYTFIWLTLTLWHHWICNSIYVAHTPHTFATQLIQICKHTFYLKINSTCVFSSVVLCWLLAPKNSEVSAMLSIEWHVYKCENKHKCCLHFIPIFRWLHI